MNFMTPTPRGGNSGVKSVKFMYFLKNLLLYSRELFRQTKYIVMMTKEDSTKIVIKEVGPRTAKLALLLIKSIEYGKVQLFLYEYLEESPNC